MEQALCCNFRTLSRHETSLGEVRYQACSCGAFRILLEGGAVALGSRHIKPARAAGLTDPTSLSTPNTS